MNPIISGSDPQSGKYLHAILPQAEAGVTRILAVCQDKAVIHRILQTGEIITQDLDLPLYRSILQAVDSLVSA